MKGASASARCLGATATGAFRVWGFRNAVNSVPGSLGTQLWPIDVPAEVGSVERRARELTPTKPTDKGTTTTVSSLSVFSTRTRPGQARFRQQQLQLPVGFGFRGLGVTLALNPNPKTLWVYGLGSSIPNPSRDSPAQFRPAPYQS